MFFNNVPETRLQQAGFWGIIEEEGAKPTLIHRLIASSLHRLIASSSHRLIVSSPNRIRKKCIFAELKNRKENVT